MEISEGSLQEFQQAYQKDFGEEIAPEEAREMASRLLSLYELLARPLPSEVEARATRLSDAENRLPPDPQKISLPL